VAKDGALVELNSETDFVAKNAEFQALADLVVTAAAAAKATDVDALKAAKAGDSTVEQAVADMSAQARREARAASGLRTSTATSRRTCTAGGRPAASGWRAGGVLG